MTVIYDFHDQIVLITGAGTGIGRAAAMGFAQAGAVVIASGRTESNIVETVDLIRQAGGSACAMQADITESEQVHKLCEQIVYDYGRLDIAHNNAGIFPPASPLADLDPEIWDEIVATNLSGLFHCMQAEITVMRPKHHGVIINTASNIGIHSRRAGFGAYAATKAAVSTLTAAAALDHIRDGIRINAVSPGATATRMSLRPGETEDDRAQRLARLVPIGRAGRVEEIVNTVLWLASDASSFVIGQDIVIDGGLTA